MHYREIKINTTYGRNIDQLGLKKIIKLLTAYKESAIQKEQEL